MSCAHPDPKTVPWVFCRDCGYFVEGVRMGDATNDILKERFEELQGKTVRIEYEPVDEEIGVGRE